VTALAALEQPLVGPYDTLDCTPSYSPPNPFGGPSPGRPHARLGALGAASLHSLTGRHAMADAGSVDAGL